MKKSLLALALVAAPFAASAADVDYTYLQGGYIASNWSSGLSADGSLALNEDFQLIGNYNHQNIDDNYGGGTLNNWGVGAGFRHALGSSRWDLGAQASYQKYDANSVTGSGIDVKVGVRGNVVDGLDLSAYVGDGVGPDVNRGDFGHDTYLQVGAQYNFTRNWAVSATYTDRGHNYNPFFAGVRYNF